MTSPYGSLTIQISAGLLSMIAQESDRAAARLSEENTALRLLFASAGTAVTDPSLAEALGAAVTAPPPSLLVSDLRQRTARCAHYLSACTSMLRAGRGRPCAPSRRGYGKSSWCRSVAGSSTSRSAEESACRIPFPSQPARAC